MWKQPDRSAQAQALYAGAEAARAQNPERFDLDPDAILAAAFAKTPLPEDDNGDWKEGFDAYLNSARKEGQLNALGLRSMAGTAMGKLQARGHIARKLKNNPEIRERKIDRPILIIGGWRTGTTLMQRMLDAVPALRGAMPSELTVPWRFAGLNEEERVALVSAGEAAHSRLHLLNPLMDAIHPSGGWLAEECVLALGTDFRNWGFTSTLRCPSYANWLLGQDMRSSYETYANVLRMLQDQSGRRWVLKAPAHTAELPSLLAAFPDAIIIHLHRDVVQTVTSGASLFAVFRSTYSDTVDGAEVGRYQLDMTAEWFSRAMAARDAHPGARFIDLAFTELVADPAALARKLCEACDVPWDEAAGSVVGTRLAELNRQHGTHKYAPEDFGLDPDQIREKFAGYRSRFGLA